MKFTITRTLFDDYESPCEEAIQCGEKYEIEIKDLNELIAFTEKYGKIILIPPYDEDDLFTIEIYDRYRE